MSTVVEHAVSRKEFLSELANELKAGKLTQEESAELLKEWDRENPAPVKGNAASASKPAADPNKPKATLMKAPDNKDAREDILNRLATGKIKVEEAQKLLSCVEMATRRGLFCKVSPKGALSVYGLQRMPVTLYVEQWERLFAFSDEIKAFMVEHDKELSRKPVKA